MSKRLSDTAALTGRPVSLGTRTMGPMAYENGADQAVERCAVIQPMAKNGDPAPDVGSKGSLADTMKYLKE